MGLDNPTHILLLLVLAVLVFGARRLPEIGRSLGTGMREFKQSITGESQPALPAPAEQAPPAEQTQTQTSAPQAQAQDAFAQRETSAR